MPAWQGSLMTREALRHACLGSSDEAASVHRPGALVRNGFRAFAGADGSQQPADLADFFLHETVVAWVRKWFSKHPFKAVEHVDQNLRLFLERLHECERHINDAYDVHGLCHDTVKRLHTLRDLGGARMKT